MADIEQKTAPPWHDWTLGTPDEAIAFWRTMRECALYLLAVLERPMQDVDELDLLFGVWLERLLERARTARLDGREVVGEFACPSGPEWKAALESRVEQHLQTINRTLADYGAAVVAD